MKKSRRNTAQRKHSPASHQAISPQPLLPDAPAEVPTPVRDEARQEQALLAVRLSVLEHAKSQDAERLAALQAQLSRAQSDIASYQAQIAAIYHSRRWALAERAARLYKRLPLPVRRWLDSTLSPDSDFRRLINWWRLATSGQFDRKHYLRANLDVAAARQDPISHYLLYGADEGRNPSRSFDTKAYLMRYPDVARRHANPLLHYVLFGRREGRSAEPLTALDRQVLAGYQLLPDVVKQATMPPVVEPQRLSDVSVIVPIYNGIEHLRRLLPSLLRHTPALAEVILIDDASPDPGVQPMLHEFAKAFPNTKLIKNPKNLGFVGTVNAAALHARRHFVLLNTDTVVPARWLERLMAPIFLNPAVASTTPFSNAATVFSFPEPNRDNELPLGCGVDEIDAAFAPQSYDPREVTLLSAPSGVGFCLGVNGDVWRAIGPLDTEAFGRGYGEENDWCQRAVANGFHNVLVPNLFIYHVHGGTFTSSEKKRLIDSHLRILEQRWPDYLPSVFTLIERDPWAAFRQTAFLRLVCNRRPLVIIDHAIGGGANAYRRKIVADAKHALRPIILITPDPASGAIDVAYSIGEDALTLRCVKAEDLTHLPAFQTGADIVYNNLVAWPKPLTVLGILADWRTQPDTHLSILVHDYYPVCPSYTLLDHNDRYCQVPTDLNRCAHCLQRNANAHLVIDLATWREAWGKALSASDEVVVFSQASLDIMARAYPASSSKLKLRPHEAVATFKRKPVVRASKPLVIAVIGNLNLAKGIRIVNDLCRHLLRNNRRAKVVILGGVDPAEREEFPNLTIHGNYAPGELPELIEHYRINVCLLPSIWPETFSYVTQEIMQLELPLVCFDLGAPAERTRDYARGVIAQSPAPAELVRALEQAAHRHEQPLAPT